MGICSICITQYCAFLAFLALQYVPCVQQVFLSLFQIIFKSIKLDPPVTTHAFPRVYRELLV